MLEVGNKCVAIGCTRLVDIKSAGLCFMHYKRKQRLGDPNLRRNAGGTAKIPRAQEHPLYTVWRMITRVDRGQSVCPAWRVFETFVEDVGENLRVSWVSTGRTLSYRIALTTPTGPTLLMTRKFGRKEVKL